MRRACTAPRAGYGSNSRLDSCYLAEFKTERKYNIAVNRKIVVDQAEARHLTLVYHEVIVCR